MPLLHIVFLILSVLVSNLTYSTVKLPNIDLLIAILQNTSIMVFTIMGIWVAYLYPNAIIKITKPSIDDFFSAEDMKRIKVLVGIILSSALVIGVLIIFSLLRAMLIGSELYINFHDIIKISAVSIIYFLSYVQIRAVWLVMSSNYNFLIDLKNRNYKAIRDKKS